MVLAGYLAVYVTHTGCFADVWRLAREFRAFVGRHFSLTYSRYRQSSSVQIVCCHRPCTWNTMYCVFVFVDYLPKQIVCVHRRPRRAGACSLHSRKSTTPTNPHNGCVRDANVHSCNSHFYDNVRNWNCVSIYNITKTTSSFAGTHIGRQMHALRRIHAIQVII